jgi:hypothetical protein
MKDYLSTIREMIRHEDELICARIGWMSTFQGILFAAFGLSLKNKSYEYVLLYSIIGMTIAVLTFWGVCVALLAIRRLYDCTRNKVGKCGETESGKEECPGVVGLPPGSGIFLFLTPWVMIPVLFFFVWGWIFISISPIVAKI